MMTGCSTEPSRIRLQKRGSGLDSVLTIKRPRLASSLIFWWSEIFVKVSTLHQSHGMDVDNGDGNVIKGESREILWKHLNLFPRPSLCETSEPTAVYQVGCYLSLFITALDQYHSALFSAGSAYPTSSIARWDRNINCSLQTLQWPNISKC